MPDVFEQWPQFMQDVGYIVFAFGPWVSLAIGVLMTFEFAELAIAMLSSGRASVSPAPASAGGGDRAASRARLAGLLTGSFRLSMPRVPQKKAIREAQQLSAVGIAAVKGAEGFVPHWSGEGLREEEAAAAARSRHLEESFMWESFDFPSSSADRGGD